MTTAEYVKMFQSDDYSRFNEFYKQTAKVVYFTALGILKNPALAEEIMQDTFVAFLDNIDKCRPNENVFAYISVIARNKSINYRKRASATVYGDDILDSMRSDYGVGEDGVNEILSLLESEEEREIVAYHVLIGYKFKEISLIMRKPLGTILWRYNKAMKTLREKAGTLYE